MVIFEICLQIGIIIFAKLVGMWDMVGEVGMGLATHKDIFRSKQN